MFSLLLPKPQRESDLEKRLRLGIEDINIHISKYGDFKKFDLVELDEWRCYLFFSNEIYKTCKDIILVGASVEGEYLEFYGVDMLFHKRILKHART